MRSDQIDQKCIENPSWTCLETEARLEKDMNLNEDD